MLIQTFDFQFFSRWPNGLPALARAEKQVRSNPASLTGVPFCQMRPVSNADDLRLRGRITWVPIWETTT
jgi:hypothetical protein